MTAASRTYEVRTYGCQMNVHDSERLTGLLEDAGYVARARRASRPTWSCSTPARCARTPTTSSTATSATSRRSRPRSPGMQIAVGGCLAQKDRGDDHPQGAVGRRRLRHPQHRLAAGAAGAGPGAARRRRSRSSSRSRSSPRRCRPSASRRTPPGCRSRVGLQQHLHVLHRPGAARQGEGPPARRDPRRDRGAGRRGRHRGDPARARTSTPTAWSSATGRRSRKLLRACGEIDGPGAGPVHLARTRRSSPTTSSRRWPRRRT